MAWVNTGRKCSGGVGDGEETESPNPSLSSLPDLIQSTGRVLSPAAQQVTPHLAA